MRKKVGCSMASSHGLPQEHEAGPPVAALLADLYRTLPWLADSRDMRLRALEVAGDGEAAGELVPLGHTVIVLNASQDALDAARIRLLADPDKLVGNIALARGSVADVPRRWPANTFDLILCHSVFERTIDPGALLESLVTVLKPGGYLSLAFSNAAALPLSFLAAGDVAGAKESLLRNDLRDGMFPGPLTADTVIPWLADLDLNILSVGGVGALGGLLPFLAGEGVERAELEQSLARREPYRGLAKFCHLVARKPVVFPIPL